MACSGAGHRGVDEVTSLADRARSGEVFEDDGFRLDPVIVNHLWSKNDEPWSRAIGCYHPSGLDRCPRKLWYCRIGADARGQVDPQSRLIFDTGHAVHAQLGGYMREIYSLVECSIEPQADVEMFRVSGHADAVLFVVATGEARRVIDFKTINDAGFGRLREPTIDGHGSVDPATMRNYVWQLHAYMEAFGCPLSTLYFYNKNDSRRAEFSVTYSLPLWEQIEDTIIGVEEFITTGVPPERKIDKFKCATCEYVHLCAPDGVVPATKRRKS